MDIPHKTLKSGFAMSVFGFGTWQMGGRLEHDPNNDDEKDIRAIRMAIELGVTQFDTAEQYAGGHAEEILGRAIRGHDRTKLFILSKVLPAQKRYNDYIAACEQSLKRIGTTYLDMYLLHRVPVFMEDAMRALNTLMERGLIRNIGVTNFGIESLKRAQSLTPHDISYNQVHYNLEFREPERTGLLEYCQANDIFLAAWRPVQKGALLVNSPPILLQMSQKYGKTLAQVAINWLLSQKNVITLAKTSNTEHLKENLGAIGWSMESSDIERLRREYPGQQAVSDAVPLDAQ